MQTEITVAFSKFNGDPCLVVDESTYDQVYRDELMYDDMGVKLKKFRKHPEAEFSSGKKMFEIDKFTLFDSLLPKETAENKGYRMQIRYEAIDKSEIKKINSEGEFDSECG